MIRDSDYATIVADAARALEAISKPSVAFGRLTDIITRGRLALLTKILLEQGGAVVRHGPFAGMQFHQTASEGCFVPKLLGCYEAELHPVLLELPARGYSRVIDIGCAEGYYAVGLARQLPSVQVFAHDIAPAARRMTEVLARANGLEARVSIGGEIDHRGLETTIAGRCLIFCDCEAAEYELIDPQAVPALAGADLIVELHATVRAPERTRAWIDGMAATHDVTLISHGARNPAEIPELATWKQLDQLLAVWEFRGEPTPWAWLRSRQIQSDSTQALHPLHP